MNLNTQPYYISTNRHVSARKYRSVARASAPLVKPSTQITPERLASLGYNDSQIKRIIRSIGESEMN